MRIQKSVLFGILILSCSVFSVKQTDFRPKMTLVQYFRFLRRLAIQERYIRASLAAASASFGKEVAKSQFRRLKPARQSVRTKVDIVTTTMAPTTVKPQHTVSQRVNFWQSRPTCTENITNCRVYLPCRSKMLCESNNIYCCAPDTSFCPPVPIIGIKCRRSRNTNWCRTDSDCHAAPTKRCCPTGCNYNICV